MKVEGAGSLESELRVLARPAFAGDLEACIDLVSPWLPLSTRLRNALPAIWARLLFESAFNTLVIENLDASPGKKLMALGMSIALNESWQERLRFEPPPFLAAALYSAMMDGSFVPPTDAELGAMNAAGTVTFAVLHYLQKPFDLTHPDAIKLYCAGMGGFRLLHSGYRLRQIYKEGCGETELDFMRGMGFVPYTQRAAQAGSVYGDPSYPELCGLSSEQAMGLVPGTAVRDIFQFTPPVLRFSPSERRLLRLAIHDLPDGRIGAELGLSGHTIKKLWRSIHERVAARLPELYGDNLLARDPDNITRGPEKRRILIPYLRHHLEELRPVSHAREITKGA